MSPAESVIGRSAPRHVAIIMDGNGRWAQARNLPRIAGHEAGTENIRRITTRAAELGVSYLTLWAFSTENWNRPVDEVQGILRILAETLPRETDELHRQGARLRHVGSFEGLDESLVAAIEDAIELTRDNDRITLTIAFNYGGRAEILQAVNRLLADATPAGEVDQQTFERYLQTAGMPDPDLIIRTSGEIRMSNFFLWQSAYSELYFSPVMWPDFSEDDLSEAVADYQRRERRFGGLSHQETPHSARR
jgi:undecaprenyl diphosphate synthase